VGLIVLAASKQPKEKIMLHFLARRLREMEEARRDERGFTLIELLIVVIIIGILAAIAIPVFLNQRAGAQDAAAKSQLRNAGTAQEAFRVDNNAYSDHVSGQPNANDDLADYGFRQGTPAVAINAAATDTNDYCMSAASQSGTTFYITDDNTVPNTTACP
jgi:type IV pilus assembly protein PilA